MVAVVAMFVSVGFAQPSGPPVVRGDPGAARELEALMRAGEHGSWSVKYEFTRTLAGGRALRQAMQEARDTSMHVLRSGSVMSVDKGERSYDCNLVGARFVCHESRADKVLPASEVLRVAAAAGAYVVRRASGETIAGTRARCFRVVTTGRGQLPDLGVEEDLCLAANGVSLRQRVMRASGDVDERLARSVTDRVTDSTIRDAARGFDPNHPTRQG